MALDSTLRRRIANGTTYTNEPFFKALVKRKVYREQHSDGLHFASVLVGIAAGVAGTIIYATYNERQFNRIVGKTREMSDRSGEYLGDVRDNAMHKAQNLVESARHGVENVGEKVHEVVNRVTHSTDKVADKAKSALDA